ncbi:MAG: hypothetical protein CMN57_09165 [Gammaproteobacteria bacterium]|nr:hypothetical protein [Gammaproteobacteria bacterium]
MGYIDVMHRQRRSSILSLIGILLAGWLSLACGHCWAVAGAAPPPADHCQHTQPEPQPPDCCEHHHQGPLCVEAEIGSGPLAKPAALTPVGFPDQPALQPGSASAWQAWRAPPPVMAAARVRPPASASLYLQHCAFLE